MFLFQGFSIQLIQLLSEFLHSGRPLEFQPAVNVSLWGEPTLTAKRGGTGQKTYVGVSRSFSMEKGSR